MIQIIDCPVCVHPERLEIDQDLESKTPRSVARHYNLDIEKMATHKVHMNNPTPIELFIREDAKALLAEAEYEDGAGVF